MARIDKLSKIVKIFKIVKNHLNESTFQSRRTFTGASPPVAAAGIIALLAEGGPAIY